MFNVKIKHLVYFVTTAIVTMMLLSGCTVASIYSYWKSQQYTNYSLQKVKELDEETRIEFLNELYNYGPDLAGILGDIVYGVPLYKVFLKISNGQQLDSNEVTSILSYTLFTLYYWYSTFSKYSMKPEIWYQITLSKVKTKIELSKKQKND